MITLLNRGEFRACKKTNSTVWSWQSERLRVPSSSLQSEVPAVIARLP